MLTFFASILDPANVGIVGTLDGVFEARDVLRAWFVAAIEDVSEAGADACEGPKVDDKVDGGKPGNLMPVVDGRLIGGSKEEENSGKYGSPEFMPE